jgi:hypothetical protein
VVTHQSKDWSSLDVVGTGEDVIAFAPLGHDQKRDKQTEYATGMCLGHAKRCLMCDTRTHALDDWHAGTDCLPCLDMNNHTSIFAIADHPPLSSTQPVYASLDKSDV